MKVAANGTRSLAAFARASSFSRCRPSRSCSAAEASAAAPRQGRSRMASASSSRPLRASISTATTSASCAPLQALVTMARSSRRLGAKMPGVSTKMSCALPSIAMPRTSARVVCTLCETIVTLEPTSALSSVDLPALGAPISATKPQRVSFAVLGSAIAAIRRHALALQHGRGRGLLGGALGAADAFRRREFRKLDGNAEFRIVVRARAARPRGRSASAGRAPCAHSCSMVFGSRSGRAGVRIRSSHSFSTSAAAAG